MSHTLNDPKITRAWTMYDWANSVFSLTITSAIFPPFFESMAKSASEKAGTFDHGVFYTEIFGYKIVNSALYSYTVSLGFLLVAIVNPLLSGIADARQSKKRFMQFFCYLGSLSCMLLYFFTPDTLWLGISCFALALFGFGGSLVFYNAFLPEIASEDQFDRLSARGFTMGYIGSVILLIINLVVILGVDSLFPVAEKAASILQEQPSMNPEAATAAAHSHYVGMASRLAFVTVGLWWAGFAQITFRWLPEKTRIKEVKDHLLMKGINELKKVWNTVNRSADPTIRRFLVGYFFSAMGVQTVIYVAVIFSKQELHMEQGPLIFTVLIIQLIAILGAWGFARVSERMGNIYTLLIMLVVWIGITIFAYYVANANQFYGLAAAVGIVMGGIQSMSRSTFAKLIPDGTTDTASFFSFYDITEKVATVLGTFAFGFINNFTENMRTSVLALILFFILALLFLARIKNFKEKHP